jgi:probable F420-dependent oxidoreductase
MPRFAAAVPSHGPFGDPVAVRDLVQAAEDLDYDGAWFSDRVAVPAYTASFHSANWFDALACMLVGVGATRRLRFGSDVLVAPFRNPVLLARQLATADQLSGGRITIGIGVGYVRGEFEAVGAPDVAHRGAVTDEVLEILRLALDAEPAVPISFAGRWFSFEDLHFGPRTIQAPFPLWVAGNSRPALRRAARLGTGWHPLFPTPEQYRQGRDAILAARGSAAGFTFCLSCPETEVRFDREGSHVDHPYERLGKIPDEFSWGPPIPVDPSGRTRFRGTPDQVAGDVQSFVEAGVDYFILRFWSTEPDMSVAEVVRRMQRVKDEVVSRYQ